MKNSPEGLAGYRRGVERIHGTWRAFLDKRAERLEQQRRHGVAAERVAENILEDLFTQVLDWPLADLNNQVGYADLLLSSLGIKYLIIEVKRPGALAWNRRAVDRALDQALRYAAEQKVLRIAVSDGCMLYAADIKGGGLRDRVFVSLESKEPPERLWWLSLHGIYRMRVDTRGAALDLLSRREGPVSAETPPTDDALLHPKYKVPARCFAHVGDAGNTASWKLPYRTADDSPDAKRLPKAIQAILSNYRGTKVSGVPEKDIPDVLVRLAQAAMSLGRMPHQSGNTAAVYVQLEAVLRQLGRLDEVLGA
ncbi:hypothetical protein BMS3Bbin12_00654 [bacterium BMS3Bbin12]|nr:hypothetical protein BMS3Abin12_00343 [bacterium BMS3Abin12]GBE47492.1 hypothetical protein BMS3Bbin12_00654 [bacterium BMS3Bbin12]GBE51155.1 hypothetical protein BMS3Bbin13_02110 [bacterium BMS3Bbin13]HDK03467.1 hypothetical protein [Gammaproteobacteria bacterium]